MLLHKFNLKTLPLLSLLAFVLVLLGVTALIHPGVAATCFTVVGGLLAITNRARPGTIDALLQWWDNLSYLIHSGILSLFLLAAALIAISVGILLRALNEGNRIQYQLPIKITPTQ